MTITNKNITLNSKAKILKSVDKPDVKYCVKFQLLERKKKKIIIQPYPENKDIKKITSFILSK